MSFLGIDVGTSGCKASVVDPDGKILGSGYQEYAAQRTEQGWEELDPQMIWLAVQAVIAKSLSSSGVGASIQAIAFLLLEKPSSRLTAMARYLAPAFCTTTSVVSAKLAS